MIQARLNEQFALLEACSSKHPSWIRCGVRGVGPGIPLTSAALRELGTIRGEREATWLQMQDYTMDSVYCEEVPKECMKRTRNGPRSLAVNGL